MGEEKRERRTFKYPAFISYSSQERRWAEWIHKAIEGYRIPSELVGGPGRDGPIPAGLFPLFRDGEELASSSDLNASIVEALKDSANLIVVCSPSAARSRWVNEEILTFKRLGRSGRIHAVIVEHGGKDDLTDCFPPALVYPIDPHGALDQSHRIMPLAADARAEGDGKTGAKLKLIAALLGIELNTLRRREVIAARRRMRFSQVVGGLILALAISGGVAGWYAWTNYVMSVNRLIPGVRIERRVTTVDLSGWRETTAAEVAAREKKSLAISTVRFSVVKTHGYATEFVHIMGTSSGIPPEAKCNPECVIRPRHSGDAARAPNEWDIVFDISHVPVEEQIELEVSTSFWNAFQSPEQWWAGFRILHGTELSEYTIIFPSARRPLSRTLDYYYFDTKARPYQKKLETSVAEDSNGRVERVTWTVHNPIADRSYRIKWRWDE